MRDKLKKKNIFVVFFRSRQRKLMMMQIFQKMLIRSSKMHYLNETPFTLEDLWLGFHISPKWWLHTHPFLTGDRYPAYDWTYSNKIEIVLIGYHSDKRAVSLHGKSLLPISFNKHISKQMYVFVGWHSMQLQKTNCTKCSNKTFQLPFTRSNFREQLSTSPKTE